MGVQIKSMEWNQECGSESERKFWVLGSEFLGAWANYTNVWSKGDVDTYYKP